MLRWQQNEWKGSRQKPYGQKFWKTKVLEVLLEISLSYKPKNGKNLTENFFLFVQKGMAFNEKSQNVTCNIFDSNCLT